MEAIIQSEESLIPIDDADGPLTGPKGIFIIFDYTASILAFAVNCLVLKASRSAHFDLKGYKFFFISLLASNLYLSAINTVNFIYQGILPMIPSDHSIANKCAANLFRSLQLAGYFANMFNLVGMSVDHYIGLLHPLRYSKLAKASKFAAIFLWVVGIFMGFADYPATGLIYLSKGTAANYSIPVPNEVLMKDDVTQSYAISSSIMLPLASRPEDSEVVSTTPSFLNKKKAADMVFKMKQQLAPELESPPIKMIRNRRKKASSAPLPPHLYIKKERVAETTMAPDGFGDVLKFLKVLTNQTTTPDSWEEDNSDFCRYHASNKIYLECIVMALTLLCFILLTICYSKVFREVRHHIAHISGRTLRKLMTTTLLLLATFTVCWLPFMIIEFNGLIWATYLQPNLFSKASSWYYIISNMSNSLMILYPLCGGLFYITKMRVIRRQMLQQYGRYFPCLTATALLPPAAYYRAAYRSSADYRGAGVSTSQRSAIRQEVLPHVYRDIASQRKLSNKNDSLCPPV